MKKKGFMNNFAPSAFALVVLFGSAAPVHAGLTKIAEGIYSSVDAKDASPAHSFGANAGIIIGRDGIVVVDTLISAKEARRFINDIRAVSGKPIKYVVNTHMHLDHTFGNCEFAKLGAVIIAQAGEKQEMRPYAEAALKKAQAYGLTERDREGTRICSPALAFDKRMDIDLGDRTVELIFLGHSHTGGSIVAFVPDKKVLFAGDILFTNYVPNLMHGDLDGWGKALDALAAMDADVIVPGHGPLSGKKDVEDMKNYLVLFDGKAKELAARSGDLHFIVTEMKKALPPREGLDMMIGANVQMRYLKK